MTLDSLVTRVGVALAANAVALTAASLLLDGVHVKFLFFLFLVVMFTLISLIVTPGVATLVRAHAPGLAPFIGLIATTVTLIATVILSDSLRISGILTWVIAILIIWAAALVVQYLAPLIIKDRMEAAGRPVE